MALAFAVPRAVLLRHDLPDGSCHLDWMLQRDAPAAALLTFRIDASGTPAPLAAAAAPFPAQRLADHRVEYLEYEGPIAGGRGTVVRLASGTCRILAEGEDLVVFACALGGVQRVYEATREPGGGWQVRGRPTRSSP